MVNGLEKDVETALPVGSGPSVRAERGLRLVSDEPAFSPLPPARRGQRIYVGLRRGLELIAAAALLLLFAPVMLLAALLIKATSRGPAFYSQIRVGRHGRHFVIYKLRTMIHQCESLTGPRWCIPGDPRITPLGYFLRLTHIDELPQLINVLRGDMSLIGPRPERPEFVEKLEKAIPGYRWREGLLPGITGLAQVQLPPDTDVAGVRRKVAYDLYYLRHVGFGLDVRIACCTVTRLLGISFRTARHLFRLPAPEQVERAVSEPVVSLPQRLAA